MKPVTLLSVFVLLGATPCWAQSVVIGNGATLDSRDGTEVCYGPDILRVESGGTLLLRGADSSNIARLYGSSTGLGIVGQSGATIDLRWATLDNVTTLTVDTGCTVVRMFDTKFVDSFSSAPAWSPTTTPWLDVSGLGSGDRDKVAYSFNRVSFVSSSFTATRPNVKSGASTPLIRMLGNPATHGDRWGEIYDDDGSNRILWHSGAVSRGSGGTFDTFEDALKDSGTSSSSVLTFTLGAGAYIDDWIDWTTAPSASSTGPVVKNASFSTMAGTFVIDNDADATARGVLLNCVVARGKLVETSADNCTFFDPLTSVIELQDITGRNCLVESGYSGGGNSWSTSITTVTSGYFLAATSLDFHLVSPGGDAAIDEGATLSTATDQEGDARGFDGKSGGSGTWDIGADEFYTTPAAPANFAGTAASSTSITWTWSDTTGEFSYVLHDASEVVKGTVPINVTTIAETGLSENVQYTRHVHAINGGGTSSASNSAAVYTKVHDAQLADFTALIVSSTSVEVVVTAPPNSSTGQTGCEIERTSDMVTWSAVKAFSSVYTFTDSTVDSAITYRYRIRFRNADGVASGYSPSVVISFAPVLYTPSNGSSTNDTTPTFDWSDLPGKAALTYELQVDNNSDFSSPEVNQTGLTASTHTAGTPLAAGSYYWRARGKFAGANVGPWSPPALVAIDTTAPGVATLLSPANGSYVGTATPTFDWTDVTDDAGVVYQLQVDNNSDFSSPEVSVIQISGSTYVITTALAAGTQYWRVVASDLAGNSGSASGGFSFTVDLTPPSAPTLLLPADNASVATGTPVFDWSDVTDSSGVTYHIQVDTEGTFALPRTLDVSGLSASTYTPGSSLPDGAYVWRVHAVDGAGNKTSSVIWKVTVDTTGAPGAPLIPTSVARKTKDTTPAITGKTPDPSVTVKVYFNGNLDGTTTSNGTGDWTYSPSVAKADGTYTVHAVASNGTDSPSSNSVDVTVDTVCNPPTNLTAIPLNGQIHLSWQPSPDADVIGYEVYRKLASDPDTSYTKIHNNLVVGTKYCDSTAQNGVAYTYRVRATDNTLQEGP